VRLIDVHTHTFPRTVAGAAFRSLEEMAGVKPSFDGTEAGLLATLDEAGVERAAVQSVAVKVDLAAAIFAGTAAGLPGV
jgi:uncharacterized protein